MKFAVIIPSKITVFAILSLFFMNLSFAQDDKQKSDFWKHVRFGGGIGLNTGNNVFSATLAPSAVYDFNSNFSLGLGLNGSYFSRKNLVKSTILGGSIISLYSPARSIQVSGEFEQNHVSRNFNNINTPNDSFWIPAFFVGAGYRAQNVTIGVRYDLLYDETKSISANAWAPFIRVFF